MCVEPVCWFCCGRGRLNVWPTFWAASMLHTCNYWHTRTSVVSALDRLQHEPNCISALAIPAGFAVPTLLHRTQADRSATAQLAGGGDTSGTRPPPPPPPPSTTAHSNGTAQRVSARTDVMLLIYIVHIFLAYLSSKSSDMFVNASLFEY